MKMVFLLFGMIVFSFLKNYFYVLLFFSFMMLMVSGNIRKFLFCVEVVNKLLVYFFFKCVSLMMIIFRMYWYFLMEVFIVSNMYLNWFFNFLLWFVWILVMVLGLAFINLLS